MKIIRIIVIFIVLLVVASFIPKYGRVCAALPPGSSTPCQKTQVWGFGYPVFYGEKFSGDARITEFVPVMLAVNIVLYSVLAVAIDFAVFSRKQRISKK